MLEQLEADVANVQHALLQIAVAGCAELGAKMITASDHRFGAAQAAQQPVQQVLVQLSVGRQRAMRFQDRAGGAVVIQQAKLNVFHQQSQPFIQRRLLLFDGTRRR